jgi:transposase-like protein/IS1 family transposase
MKRKPISDRCCPNPQCPDYGKFDSGNIVRHTFYKTKSGRRRRFRCRTCKQIFSSTSGTPYYRLHKSRRLFDEAAQMTVDGVSKSAIARIARLSWNTVARWHTLMARASRHFLDHQLSGFEIIELQADEIKTFVQRKKDEHWIFTALEVWSRLWISYQTGRRSFRNIKKLLGEVWQHGKFVGRFLFTTDGYEPYGWAAKKIFGVTCLYGQVVKKRRHNRVVRVTRRLLIGTAEQLEELLFQSEDSATLNTSFIERHNLTIRQGVAYLGRRTACHARDANCLDDLLAIQQCYYNFIRPHRGLKFGKEYRTPAMQAGLASKRLTFREVFTSREAFLLCRILKMPSRQEGLNFKERFAKLATVA